MAVLLGFICFGNIQEARAHVHYTTIPKSLRGTWYHWKVDTNHYDKIVFSKYIFYFKDGHHKASVISGKKKARYINHSELSVNYVKHGYYTVGRYGLDEGPYLKRSKTFLWTDKGKKTFTCLKEYEPIPNEYGHHDVEYWFHFKQ